MNYAGWLHARVIQFTQAFSLQVGIYGCAALESVCKMAVVVRSQMLCAAPRCWVCLLQLLIHKCLVITATKTLHAILRFAHETSSNFSILSSLAPSCCRCWCCRCWSSCSHCSALQMMLSVLPVPAGMRYRIWSSSRLDSSLIAPTLGYL